MKTTGGLVAIVILFSGGLAGCSGPTSGLKMVCQESGLRDWVWQAGRQPLAVAPVLAPSFKPYVRELYTPTGVQVLRDDVDDHPHHHGLMFAVNVDGVEFWGETQQSGTQWLYSIDKQDSSLVQTLHWLALDRKTVLLREQRTIRAELLRRGNRPPATLLSWSSALSLPSEKLTAELTGREYLGLGMRFVPSMDKGGDFRNADGASGVPGTNTARSRWCAYTAAVDGQAVTIAVFDHPFNPRHPATWFTMNDPFAYISATLDLHKQPLVVEADEPVTLRYGIALWDGRVDTAIIETAYQYWR